MFDFGVPYLTFALFFKIIVKRSYALNSMNSLLFKIVYILADMRNLNYDCKKKGKNIF